MSDHRCIHCGAETDSGGNCTEYCQVTTITGDLNAEEGMLPMHLCSHGPTLKLRWLAEGKNSVGEGTYPKLQQAWCCLGCEDMYWEDIPIVIEGEEDEEV